jgi:hypothetical protein
MRPPRGVTPAFITIREFTATSGGGWLTVSISLAANVPPGTPLVGQLAYRFLLDTNEDGDWDKAAALELTPGGGYVSALVDRSTMTRLEGPRFPGTASLAGSRITLAVELKALACPAVIGIRALAEQTKDATTLADAAPGRDDWTIVETGC